MANPNIVNVTSIIGRTTQLAVTTTPTNIIANAAASGKIIKVNSLYIANIDGTLSADITVDLYRGAVAYPIAKVIPVVAGSTLVVISKDGAIYLEEGDSLRCTASVAGDLQALASYEEIS